MREMQRVNGHGSFIGYARKLYADVDARTTVCDMRQHRRSLDSSPSDDSAHSESQTAHDTSCKNSDSTGSGSVVGERPSLSGRRRGFSPAKLRVND